MNKQPNGTDMILHLFREGQRFADEAADSLPERGVESFKMRGSAGFFASWTVPLCGQRRSIRGPKIGVDHGTLAIQRWERFPEFLGSRLIPLPNRDTDNLTGVSIQGQPQPLLVRFFLDKRPTFVTFHRQSPFFFGWTATVRGTVAYFLFT